MPKTTTTHAFLTSASFDYSSPLPPTTVPIVPNSFYQAQYFTMQNFSDNDNGAILIHKLQHQPGRIVGDGSYDPWLDKGSGAIILECLDQSSRMTNAALVPSNPVTHMTQWSDPYRCKIFAIYIGLYNLFHIKQQFNVTLQPITFTVDNDSTLDMSIIYTSPIELCDQHSDLLSAVCHLRSKINTEIKYERVTGHRDRHLAFHQLTRIEQLNVECDMIAKFALKTFPFHTQLQPNLCIPYETCSIWYDGIKLYKDFQ